MIFDLIIVIYCIIMIIFQDKRWVIWQGIKKTAICCSFKNIRSHHYYKAINYNDLWGGTGNKKETIQELSRKEGAKRGKSFMKTWEKI